MKIALAQINPFIGNFSSNTDKIISYCQKALEDNADLIVFPELAICGYPPRDFLLFEDFIQSCLNKIDYIASQFPNLGIIIGTPVFNHKPAGKSLHNAACFLYEGKRLHTIHKTLLPTYDVFDEYRYFEPGINDQCILFKGKKIAITICEDIWNPGFETPLYPINPLDSLCTQNPDFIINLSASPFNYNQSEQRHKVLKANTIKYKVPLIYCNQVGAQTELIFDGNSSVYNELGEPILQLKPFQEDLQSIDLDTTKQSIPVQHGNDIELIHDALVCGIRDYFQKLNFSKAILGLSGGIDSALTLALAAKALGNQNVLSVLLPSQFSSDHSITDSLELVQTLESPHHTISIEETVQAVNQTLQPYFKETKPGLAEENIQARSRAILLMALSNKFGYILLNTSNKSEAAVGYGTLYGDMCGGLSVLGDVYKTQVYQLANYINRDKIIIPENIINKAPSAELRPGQKDQDSLPPYDVLDAVLYQYIEQKHAPHEIIQMGFDPELVAKVLKMVNTNEWKRYQTPPILRVSPTAFGMGRRMPIVAKYLS